MLRTLAVFGILLCAVSSVLFAQTPDTATVQGRVEDANQAPIAGVLVTLTNTLSGLSRTVQTDTAGEFSVPGLPAAGTYSVLNDANFVGYSGTYGNGSTAGKGFGQPLAGVTNQLTARSFQFSAQLMF